MYASYQDHHVCHDDYFQENILLPGGQQVALPSHILSRVDLEIAFGFEKLLNLEMLVMEVARRAADIEPLMQQDPQSISAESVDKAFEFHVLYAIVDSEANELEKLVDSIRMDIANAETKVSEEEPGSWLTYKLNTATDSLKQMQELISTIRRESATFDKTIQPSHNKEGTGEVVGYENGHLSPHATLQADDQRNFLQMLQQSIASELDLQKKAFDSQSAVEDLKLKLRYAEQELYFLEESTEALYERMFAAENVSQLFLGTSKELVGTINTIQSSLSASVRREGALKSKLEESLMKLNASQSSREIVLGDSDNNASQEAVQMQTLSPPEFLTLWNKIQQLEVWLRDSGSQPQCSSLSRGATEEEQNMIRSERFTLGDIISDIKTAISNAESRTQKAETKCAHLTQTNVQLNGELNSLKSQGSDRAGLLETKLKESDTQLEHARASVDAIVEQQGMLRSSMSDMEHVIGDLKEKYLKAETRAENAESKCSLLTDTNLELSEELSFLRGRVESLENSLHQANQLKMSTAKDIGGKTKTITDLVAKLALERERLHTKKEVIELLPDVCAVQIVTLMKKNRILAQKCKENDNGATSLGKEVSATEGELRPVKVMEEASLNSSKEPKAAPTGSTLREKVEADEVSPLEDESGGRSTLETVRSIEPALLNWRYISAAVLVLLAAVLVYQPYQSHDRVQQLIRKILG